MDIEEITPDTIELDNLDLESSGLKLLDDVNDDFNNNQETSRPSVNFGSGIELLMNEKNKNEKKNSTNIDIDDINDLENELNNLTETVDVDIENLDGEKSPMKKTSTKKNIFGNLFRGDSDNGEKVEEVKENKSNIGKQTANMNENKTWDGFGKFNNIPVNLEKTEKAPQLTKEEELKEKFKYLRKLEELEKKGVSLTKRYNMDSDLQEMMGEYEMIIAEKEKSNSVKFQGKMLMACITGLEFLNNKFDPFDIKLDGWGEQVNENIDEYDEIFAELHEKYKSKAKMSPELKLLFQLGGSAIMVHMSNTLFKSSMPGMDDIMKQNPELMKQFTQAAVNTMGQENPGFGGFMNNIFNGGGSSMPPVSNMGPPPPPTETKLPERSQRTQNLSNRPDIMSARGVNINQNQGVPDNEERITRPEMSGPSQSLSSKQSEINNILGGLKTKQINVNESSTISIEDIKDLTELKGTKSKRKQKSDKNIVSLDI